MVPRKGLEPSRLAAHGPEPCASTNSATWARGGPLEAGLPGVNAVFSGRVGNPLVRNQRRAFAGAEMAPCASHVSRRPLLAASAGESRSVVGSLTQTMRRKRIAWRLRHQAVPAFGSNGHQSKPRAWCEARSEWLDRGEVVCLFRSVDAVQANAVRLYHCRSVSSRLRKTASCLRSPADPSRPIRGRFRRVRR